MFEGRKTKSALYDDGISVYLSSNNFPLNWEIWEERSVNWVAMNAFFTAFCKICGCGVYAVTYPIFISISLSHIIVQKREKDYNIF